MSKKNSVVFIIVILLPVLIFLLGCVEKSSYFYWGYACSKNLTYLLNLVTLVGLVYLLFSWKVLNNLWRVILSISLVISIAHLILFFSLSNFGF